jgi:cysteine dioxygenase
MCDELRAVVERHPLNRPDLDAFVRFREAGYFHQPIAEERHFEVGCIGWRVGHASPIHDHRGSACCVQVIEGVLTNTDFMETASGELVVSSVMRLTAGGLFVRSDRQAHRVSNDDPAEGELISLHVYSPPLRPLTERVREPFISVGSHQQPAQSPAVEAAGLTSSPGSR